VGLVDDEDRAGSSGDVADRIEVPRLWQDDPDVRERGLDEKSRDLAVGQGLLEAGDVI
jgi:hypothetical protein